MLQRAVLPLAYFRDSPHMVKNTKQTTSTTNPTPIGAENPKGRNLLQGYNGKGSREGAGTEGKAVLTGHPMSQTELSQGKVGAGSPPPGAGNRIVPTTDTSSLFSWKFRLL